MTALDPSQYKIGQTVHGTATLSIGKTRPPRAFEEGDLIDIMDDIGRYAQIGKDDMAILKERNAAGSGKAGIGTARTRGETIKKCFSAGFLERYKEKKKTYIRPTEKAMVTYDLLIDKPASRVLVTPEMTAKWEAGLKKIENGTLTKEKFLSMITDMVIAITNEIMANPTNQSAPFADRPVVEPHPMDGDACPKCKKGKLVTRVVSKPESKSFGKRFVSCDNKPCGFFGEFID
jgi:DNA topoisomerase-3